MAESSASTFRKRMLAIEQNMKLRTPLSLSMASFMLGVSELVKDVRLAKVTNRFWTPGNPPDPDKMHRFTCIDTRPLQFPEEWWTGEPIVPDRLYAFIDPEESSYHFCQNIDRADDEEGSGVFRDEDGFKELTIVMSNLRSTVDARWEATIIDHGHNQIVNLGVLAASNTISADNVDDFGLIASIVQTSLLGMGTKGATFVRQDD
ncbi:MAG TPA: hypothetical protein VFB59_05450 [Candidatus Saccharimonadales bacterium]|nr:hypothetical protein [Candidatus Saccharimonadales bacterium]